MAMSGRSNTDLSNLLSILRRVEGRRGKADPRSAASLAESLNAWSWNDEKARELAEAIVKDEVSDDRKADLQALRDIAGLRTSKG